jgi:hypothetical protein
MSLKNRAYSVKTFGHPAPGNQDIKGPVGSEAFSLDDPLPDEGLDNVMESLVATVGVYAFLSSIEFPRSLVLVFSGAAGVASLMMGVDKLWHVARLAFNRLISHKPRD